MGFARKLLNFRFKGLPLKKKENRAWGVILKGAPDKHVEEILVRLFTEKLGLPGDNALRIIRSVPVLLFDERTASEAEQMKLILNQTGARTSISNDPDDFKNLSRVVWPKRVEVEGWGGEAIVASLLKKPPPPPERRAPRPAVPSASPPPVSKISKPIVPTPSKIPPPPVPTPEKPVPPPAPALDWKSKYDNLQKSYLDAIDRLEKKEVELKIVQDRAQKLEQEGKEADPKLSLLEAKAKALMEEKDRKIDELRKDLDQSLESQELLDQELRRLRQEREAWFQELRKTKTTLESRLEEVKHKDQGLQSQLKRVEKMIALLRKLKGKV